MRPTFKFVALILAGVLMASSGPLMAHGTASSTSNSAFGDALNAYRARHGAGPLVADAELAAAARRYAEEMTTQRYFSHVAPDGTNAMVRASVAGCSWGSIGENLASGYASTADVLQGWANSPSHNRTMLGRNYTRYGMGRVGTMWVLMFADHC